MSNIYDPKDPRSVQDLLYQPRFQLTPEETEVWQNCMRAQSFWSGGLATGLYMGSMGYIVMEFFKNKQAKWFGLGVGGLGFLLAKYNHSKTCFQKVMEVPNSRLRVHVESLKQGRGFMPQSHSIEPVQPTDEITDHSRGFALDSTTSSTADFDTYSPVNHFDGFFRTNDDDQPLEELDLTENIGSRHNLTYDELRQKNRESALQSKVNRQPQVDRRYKAYEPTPVIEPSSSPRPVIETKYGDVWG